MRTDPQGAPTTYIDKNYAAVHSGIGDQNNSYVFPDLRRAPWLEDGESEEWLERVFVPPPRWEEAVNRLKRTGSVALAGPLGTGKQAAGRRLLGTLRRAGDAPIRRPAPTDDADRLPLADDISSRGRLLFDLSDSDLAYRQRVLDELPGVRQAALERGAFIVVVLPEPDLRVADEWLRRTAVPLGQPDPTRLVANHLREFRVAGELPEDPNEKFVALLRDSRPAELARLTWFVSQSALPDEPIDLDQRLLAAARSSRDEAQSVAQRVATQPDGRQRALLLAAAMFTRFPAESVHQAQRLLIDTLGFPNSETHELAEPDLGHRLGDIGVILDKTGTTTFPTYGADEAVRRHFWVNFPGLRERFIEWVVLCGRSNIVGGRPGEPSRAGELIGRFVDVCVQVGRIGDAIKVAENWAAVEKPVSRDITLASMLLRDALDRPAEARRIRQACYEWARRQSTPPGLAQAVIVASERGIAPRQPGEAVVRLDHLLRHSDPAVAADAAAALSRLAASDPQLQRRILARLGHPAVESLRHPGGRAAFRGVADPYRLATTPAERVLLDDDKVCRDLVTGWRAVLRLDDAAERESTLHGWLVAHVEHRHNALVDVLVDACRQDFQLVGKVFGSARRWWANDPESRRATLVQLEKRITRSRTSLLDPPPSHGQNGA